MNCRLTKILAASLLVVAAGCTTEIKEKWSQLIDRSDRKPAESEIHDAPEPRIAPETHYASGMMLERQGNFMGAIKQYQKATEGDPSMVDAHNRLGMAHTRLGQFRPAESAFRRAIDLEPKAPALHNNLGFCLLMDHKYKDAESAFRKALDLAPDFERARMNLGIALARQRRLGDAAVEFSRVVPAEAAYYNVGVVCMEMDDQTQAEQAFRKALQVKPDYEPAMKRLASLSGRRTTPVAPTPNNRQAMPRIVEPPHVTARANEPVGNMKLAGDTNADAPSP